MEEGKEGERLVDNVMNSFDPRAGWKLQRGRICSSAEQNVADPGKGARRGCLENRGNHEAGEAGRRGASQNLGGRLISRLRRGNTVPMEC